MRHQMLSCIISQRHRWGMGCRSGLMYQCSSFSAWVWGDQHTSRTESVSAALEFLWFIPAAPIVHESHHSEHSLHNSYRWGSVYDCAVECSKCGSSLLPLWSFTILQLLWLGLDVILSYWQGSYAVPWCRAWGQIHSSTTTRRGGCKACKTESWEKGQEEVTCLAVWRSGKELQKAAVLWEETLHRKLCKKEECSPDFLTSFFLWKNEWIGSMHCNSGGDLLRLLYSKLLKMEIWKMKSIFQTHSISGWKETNIFTFYF